MYTEAQIQRVDTKNRNSNRKDILHRQEIFDQQKNILL